MGVPSFQGISGTGNGLYSENIAPEWSTQDMQVLHVE